MIGSVNVNMIMGCLGGPVRQSVSQSAKQAVTGKDEAWRGLWVEVKVVVVVSVMWIGPWVTP